MNEKKEIISILEKIIIDFSTDNLVRLFRNKTTKFRLLETPVPNDLFFTDGLQLGEFECNGNSEQDFTSLLCVYVFKADHHLTERSGKKDQYELAKKILKQEIRYSGGFYLL